MTNLISNFDEERGNPLRCVVKGGHVEDHLDNVEQAHQRSLHVGRILVPKGIVQRILRWVETRLPISLLSFRGIPFENCLTMFKNQWWASYF